MTLEDLWALKTCDLVSTEPVATAVLGLDACALTGANTAASTVLGLDACALEGTTQVATEVLDLDPCSLSNDTVLDGGSLNSITRVGDDCNLCGIGTTVAFTAKILLDEHVPYIIEHDADNVEVIVINIHFLKEARRQLSGEVLLADSGFSPYEQSFYDDYILWVDGAVYIGELLEALMAFDFWLIEEVQEHIHPVVTREYSTTHKWRKTDERVI